MKTPLAQLIEKWENETGSYIPNAPIYKAFIEEAKEFLEKENQQIKIADEFAVDFAEWIDKNYMQHPDIHNFYAKSEDDFNKGNTYHIKQLLEIFKKQQE